MFKVDFVFFYSLLKVVKKFVTYCSFINETLQSYYNNEIIMSLHTPFLRSRLNFNKRLEVFFT